MKPLPLAVATASDCWNRIGVHGDRSCPELACVVHCHNCEVFATAGRRFLDAPSPAGYLEEWTQRLAAPIEEASHDLLGVLIFRLGEEWLGLPVAVLVEVATLRPMHCIPHRGGILAGLVNIRGELHLSAHIDQVLGIARKDAARKEKKESGSVSISQSERSSRDAPPGQKTGSGRNQPPATLSRERLLVVRRETERWVFRVDEVDQVHRFPLSDLTAVPATVGRSAVHLTSGVFHWQGRTVGLLDDERLFQTLRMRMR